MIHIAGKTPREFLHALFTSPTRRGSIQLFRYGIVAMAAFVIDFGLLYVFTSLWHLYYLLSTTLSFTISAVLNYYLSTLWVFARRNKRQRSVEVTIFIAICFVALLLNDLFMLIFTTGLHIQYLISKLLTVVIVFFWSFAARRIMFHADISRFWVIRKLVKSPRSLLEE